MRSAAAWWSAVLPFIAMACAEQAPLPAKSLGPTATPTAITAAAAATEDFRAKPPPTGVAIDWVPPTIEEGRLANGIRVLIVARHELPVVAVNVACLRSDDKAAPGIPSFAMAALMLGSKRRNEGDLSDALQRLGTHMNAGADHDAASLSVLTLAANLAPSLDLAAEIVTSPAFPKDEFEKYRTRRLTSLQSLMDNPRALAVRAALAALYPEGSLLATPPSGTMAVVRAARVADLVRWHAMTVRPERLIITFAGDITRATAMAEAERTFGGFRPSGPPTSPRAPQSEAAPVPSKPEIVLVDRPGATQSVLYWGRPGVARKTPDFEAIEVANTIYGGQFTSRLNLNLREKHGFTYGANSGFEMGRSPGPFQVVTSVVRESTAASVREMVAELARMRDELPSEEELADAKGLLNRKLPASFESLTETAATLTNLAVFGLPLDEATQRRARTQKVSREDVRAVARKVWASEPFRLVVVGDAKVVEAPLAALGLGAIVRKAPAEILK